MPAGADYLWRVFLRLSRRRGSNGFGPDPVSFIEIETFTRLAGFPLAPWEIEILEHLDDIYLEVRGEETAEALEKAKREAQQR